jgi:hypothetical protein
MRNGAIGEELGADLVLRLDLEEFTNRATDTRELRKARVAAQLLLYECGDRAGLDSVYSDDVSTTYPPDSHHGIRVENDADLMHDAVELFADAVARKFYEHERRLQARPSW